MKITGQRECRQGMKKVNDLLASTTTSVPHYRCMDSDAMEKASGAAVDLQEKIGSA